MLETLENILGFGESSYIFELSKTKVVKVYNPSIRKDQIYREFEIAKKVFDCGIRIPRPYSVDLFYIKWPEEEIFAEFAQYEFPGFVMERIYGITGNQLKGKFFNDAFEKYKALIEVAKEKGFIVSDIKSGNFMIIKNTMEIVIIDVERWYKLK